MMTQHQRITSFLLFASLLACATPASAQRRGSGGGGNHAQAANRGGGGANRAQASANRGGYADRNKDVNRNRDTNRAENVNRNKDVNRNGNYNGNRNGNYNGNRNGNYNGNRNVNVNHNVNVNVNHNVRWNGNTWGGSRVYVGRYNWPHGYTYVRRPVGWIMPTLFLTSAYYYSSWATLGLTAPPPSYQWVRYGSDLLLVDTRTGRVTDVRYGVFQ